METKNNDYEEVKGCLFPVCLVIVMVVMTLITITCVNNRIRRIEDKQDTILKTIRGYDWGGTADVDSTVDSTATDSSVVADDDEYCEDCENGDEDDEPRVFVCSGRYAKRYHRTPSCDGLQSCKGITINIPLSEAMHKGLTPCHRCIHVEI